MDRLIGADEAAQSEKRAAKADQRDGLARDVTTIKLGDCLLGYKVVQRRMRVSRWNHFRGRVREIEKLIRHRHGDIVPEADDALIYVEVIASLAFVDLRADKGAFSLIVRRRSRSCPASELLRAERARHSHHRCIRCAEAEKNKTSKRKAAAAGPSPKRRATACGRRAAQS
ncbi:hypothetical protein FHT79_002606 [Rhizobium sp. BK212]|nr:hypothetical protein [Rhizobium sp. BK212]